MQTHIDGPVLLVLQRPVAEDFMVVLNAGGVLGARGPCGAETFSQSLNPTMYNPYFENPGLSRKPVYRRYICVPRKAAV